MCVVPLNAFFVFTVCLTMGYTWQFALTAVLIEGVIFIIMSLTGLRRWLLQAIPGTLKKAIGVCQGTELGEKENIDGLDQMFLSDAVATVAGACLGTSTTTTYVESASGVSAGGRTGLTAFTIGMCFLVSIFFAPIFLAIPGAATAPALIIVGVIAYVITHAISGKFKEISTTMWVLAVLFILRYIFI